MSTISPDFLSHMTLFSGSCVQIHCLNRDEEQFQDEPSVPHMERP